MIHWHPPFSKFGEFVRIHVDTMCIHFAPKYVQYWGEWIKFLPANIESFSLQMRVDPEEPLIVLLNSVSAHEYIIEPSMNIHADSFMENPSKNPLEHRGGVTVPLLHYIRLESPVGSGKSAVLNTIRFNTDLLVSISHIDF